MTSPMMEPSVLGKKLPDLSQIDNDEKPSGKKGKTKKAKPKWKAALKVPPVEAVDTQLLLPEAPTAALPPAEPSAGAPGPAGTPSTSAPTSAPLRALSEDASHEDNMLTNKHKRVAKKAATEDPPAEGVAAPLPAAESPMGQAAKIITVAGAKPAEAIAATLPDDELKKTAAAAISEAIRSSSLKDTLESLKQKKILQLGKAIWHLDQDTGDIHCYMYIDQKKLKSSARCVVLNFEMPLADGCPNVKLSASITPDSNHVGAREGSFKATAARGCFSLKAETPADLREDVATCSVQFSLVGPAGNLEYGPAQEHNFVAMHWFKDRKIWDFNPFFDTARTGIGMLGFLKVSRILKIPFQPIESGRSGLGNTVPLHRACRAPTLGLGLGSLPISEMPASPLVPDMVLRVKNTFLEPDEVGSEPPLMLRHRSRSHGDLQQLPKMDEADELVAPGMLNYAPTIPTAENAAQESSGLLLATPDPTGKAFVQLDDEKCICGAFFAVSFNFCRICGAQRPSLKEFDE